MKKTLLACTALFCAISTYAQNGFFLQPIGGVGMANQTTNGIRPRNPTLVFDGRVYFGYQKEKLVFITGIGYLRAGEQWSYQYTDAMGNPIGEAHLYDYFGYIMVPVGVGYKALRAKTVEITPMIGAELSYNESYIQVNKFGKDKHVLRLDRDQFNQNFRRVSGWGFAKVDIDFKLSQRLSITCSPTVDYMITNMIKKPSSARLRNYAVLLNAGVKWTLPTKAKAKP